MVLHVAYAALAEDTASRTAVRDEFGTCDNRSFVDGSYSGISISVVVAVLASSSAWWLLVVRGGRAGRATTKEPLTKLANRGTSSFIPVRRTSHGADRGMDLMLLLPRAAALIDIVSE